MQYRAMKQKLPKKKENLKKAFTLSNYIKEQSLQMANTIQSRTQLVSLWLFLLPYLSVSRVVVLFTCLFVVLRILSVQVLLVFITVFSNARLLHIVGC